MRLKARRPMLLLISWVLIAMTCPAVADEGTDQKIDYEAGFYYTVKTGDTLWDLSQRFSDTPWQWPDLWHENKQLPNPHWIYPGERIRLFRKTDLHRVQTPPLKAIPAVAHQVNATPQAATIPPQVEFIYANIDQVGFIRNPPVKPQGTIVKSLGNKRLISEGDLVYLSYSDSTNASAFAPGTRMTVYRTMDHPTDYRRSFSNFGKQHYLLGLVEITRSESQYAIGKIMKSYRAINIEDQVLVMPYDPKSPSIPVVESTPGIQGRVIGGEDHNKLLSDHYITFIDKGAEDKIEPGQIYHLYNQEIAPAGTGGAMVALEPVYTGSMLVLHTEQTTSTVVITHNIQKITAGDNFHTP